MDTILIVLPWHVGHGHLFPLYVAWLSCHVSSSIPVPSVARLFAAAARAKARFENLNTSP